MQQINVKLNERGAALIAGLLILVVLSILGITTMQSSLLQERMAGNFEQKDQAFQAAEAGLRDAENFIVNTALLPAAFNGTNGLYSPAAAGNLPQWQAIDWSNASNYRTYSNSDFIGNLPPAQRPRYIIEFVTSVSDGGNEGGSLAFGFDEGSGSRVYRISSRGQSSNGRAVVLLQTTFLHRL